MLSINHESKGGIPFSRGQFSRSASLGYDGYWPSSAGMVESADTADLKSADHKMVVGVQVPLPAPLNLTPLTFHLFRDRDLYRDYR